MFRSMLECVDLMKEHIQDQNDALLKKGEAVLLQKTEALDICTDFEVSGDFGIAINEMNVRILPRRHGRIISRLFSNSHFLDCDCL